LQAQTQHRQRSSGIAFSAEAGKEQYGQKSNFDGRANKDGDVKVQPTFPFKAIEALAKFA
jgi:hypothetical protein